MFTSAILEKILKLNNLFYLVVLESMNYFLTTFKKDRGIERSI